jgi:imidazolonepropionase-like amidohydrolase
MNLTPIAAALAVLTLSASVHAESNAESTGGAARITAVRAGKLVDVVAGKVLDNQTILISGDRITAVGPTGSLGVPAGAAIVDLSSATVLPGLVDAHTHLTGCLL